MKHDLNSKVEVDIKDDRLFEMVIQQAQYHIDTTNQPHLQKNVDKLKKLIEELTK